LLTAFPPALRKAVGAGLFPTGTTAPSHEWSPEFLRLAQRTTKALPREMPKGRLPQCGAGP